MRMPRPAAAGLGFENDGITHLLRPHQRFFRRCQHAIGSRQDRHPGLLHGLARLFLFAHQARNFRRRPDELDVRRAAHFGKIGVLAEQSVTGMNGIDVGDFRGGDDGGHVEIAVGGTRRPDADGLVGEANMERVAIGLAVDGDGADAEFPAGVHDAQSNFAAIGN